MSSVVLSGDTSGTVTVTVPAVAGTNTVTVPAGTGTMAVQGVSTNIVSGTAVASTSGTSIDFTSIPSWVKRITVMFNGVSTNGTSNVQVQLGYSGGVETTGYSSQIGYITGSNTGNITSATTGILTVATGATSLRNGNIMICNVSGNIWAYNGVVSDATSGIVASLAGTKTTTGTLTTIRITTVNGTDTFDAGSINILYE